MNFNQHFQTNNRTTKIDGQLVLEPSRVDLGSKSCSLDKIGEKKRASQKLERKLNPNRMTVDNGVVLTNEQMAEMKAAQLHNSSVYAKPRECNQMKVGHRADRASVTKASHASRKAALARRLYFENEHQEYEYDRKQDKDAAKEFFKILYQNLGVSTKKPVKRDSDGKYSFENTLPAQEECKLNFKKALRRKNLSKLFGKPKPAVNLTQWGKKSDLTSLGKVHSKLDLIPEATSVISKWLRGEWAFVSDQRVLSMIYKLIGDKSGLKHKRDYSVIDKDGGFGLRANFVAREFFPIPKKNGVKINQAMETAIGGRGLGCVVLDMYDRDAASRGVTRPEPKPVPETLGGRGRRNRAAKAAGTYQKGFVKSAADKALKTANAMNGSLVSDKQLKELRKAAMKHVPKSNDLANGPYLSRRETIMPGKVESKAVGLKLFANMLVDPSDPKMFSAQSSLAALHRSYKITQLSVRYKSLTPEINAPSGNIMILWLNDPSSVAPTLLETINTTQHRMFTTAFNHSDDLIIPPSKSLYTGTGSDGGQAPGNRYHGRLLIYTDLDAIQTSLGNIEISSTIKFTDFTRADTVTTAATSQYYAARSAMSLVEGDGAGGYQAKPSQAASEGTSEKDEGSGAFAAATCLYDQMTLRPTSGWDLSVPADGFTIGDIVMVRMIWASPSFLGEQPFKTPTAQPNDSLIVTPDLGGDWALYTGFDITGVGWSVSMPNDDYLLAIDYGQAGSFISCTCYLRVLSTVGNLSVAMATPGILNNGSTAQGTIRWDCYASVVGNVPVTAEKPLDASTKRSIDDYFAKLMAKSVL